jgi:light-regulated signal transduction histidine kinase (bacteriophytochrome)
MQGFTEALLEDYGEHLDSTGQDYAQRFVAASHRMDALIQDLLAYSRLSRTEVRLDPVNVETVVDEDLEGHDVVYLEGGDHRRLLRMPGAQFAELMRAARHGRFSKSPTH